MRILERSKDPLCLSRLGLQSPRLWLWRCAALTSSCVGRWHMLHMHKRHCGKHRLSGLSNFEQSTTGRTRLYEESARSAEIVRHVAHPTRKKQGVALPGRIGYEGSLQVTAWKKPWKKEELRDTIEALALEVQSGFCIDGTVLYGVLKRCIAEKNLVLSSRIHAVAAKSGQASNPFFAHHMIRMYDSHGRLEEAMQVFSKVAEPDRYMWASIIMAHARHGKPIAAIMLYRQMRGSPVKADNHIFVAVLKACAAAKDLSSGKEVHYDIVGTGDKPNVFVGSSLINMYAKCGRLEDARKVFDDLPDKNVVAWNAMITGYSQHGFAQETLLLYTSMQQAGVTPTDAAAFACLLQACASIGALHEGKQLHAQIRKRGLEADVVVGNCLVNMYAKCSSLEDARQVFDNLSGKDVVTWNAMIGGYSQNGLGRESLNLFGQMQRDGMTPADSITYVSLLHACSALAALEVGKEIHAQISKIGLDRSDPFVVNALIDMYSKCGSMTDARRVFDNSPTKDVVTWTVMISGYTQQSLGHDALALFESMQQEGITPANHVTFMCLLQACSSAAHLDKGREIHALISNAGLDVTDSFVASTLIDMYGKCGSMSDAQQVFDAMPVTEIVSWNALIAGYAREGDCDRVFDSVSRMQEGGIVPNGVTFLSILSVCSHVGLVDKGQNYFMAMSRDYGISPTEKHYNCVIDLLGRAGELEKAMTMVKAMPFQPHVELWRSLLASCRKWRNVDLAREAFHWAIRLDKNDPAAYILMSNIYAAAQMWEEAKEIRAMRMKAGARKDPGQSWWTDDVGVMHTFVVGD